MILRYVWGCFFRLKVVRDVSKNSLLFSQVVDGAEIQALVSDSGIDLLNNASHPGGIASSSEDNPPDQAAISDPAQGSRASTGGDLSRGRRRARSTDGGVDHENGNESDMDLEFLAETESDSDEDGVPPGEDRVRRLDTGGFDRPLSPCIVTKGRVLYSDDDSSSAEEDVVENDIDQVEDDEELDEEGVGRDENENSGARVLDVQRAGQFSCIIFSWSLQDESS